MKIKFRICFIVMLSLVPHLLFPQQYKYRNFSTEDGIPQPYIYSVCQDSLGYLWIGTGEGLSRFNGFSFEVFTTDDLLPSNFVTTSLSNGKEIWFGHANGAVSLFDGNSFRKVPLNDSIPDRLTCLSRSPEGNIWAATFVSGIYRLNREFMYFEKIIPLAHLMVNSICIISRDEILAGTNTGLYIVTLDSRGEMMSENLVTEIPPVKITSLIRLKNQHFLVATENDGIYDLEKEGSNYKVSLVAAGEIFSGIQNIYEDSQNSLWIATFGNGLIKLFPGGQLKYQIFQTKQGFITDNVRIVFEDREGNIWSGNFGDGLTMITHQAFSFFRTDEKYGSPVFSILADSDFLWFGTDRGLLKTERSTGSVLRFYGKESGLSSDTVTALYLDDSQYLWIGTGNSGVFRLNTNENSVKKIKLPGGRLENSVTALTGSGDKVYIGTKKGLNLYDRVSGETSTYTITQGLPHNWINSIYAERPGKLWITSKSKILSYLEDGKIVKYPGIIGSGTAGPGPVKVDDKARIWVGSAGNGIFLLNADSVINLTMQEGLLSDYCYSLIHNGKFVWVAHWNGLSRIDMTNLTIKPFPGSGTFEYIQYNSNAADIDPYGKIWFGSDKGITVYDPDSDVPILEPPLLSITSVFVNDHETYFKNGRILLPPGRYKVRIDYLGCSLREPQLVSYRLRLEGYDQGWSEPSGSRSVTYPNLTDGEFSFLLQATNGDGIVTNEPLKLQIIIRKPVWKLWWFFPVLTILCAIVLFNYVKYRERKLRAEKKILEAKVKERTSELEIRKNEIEQQRDEITEKNQNITASIKYARQIQKALLPPVEVLDRALPDSFIIHKPRDIVSGDFYWIAERDEKVIFTVADCTGHGVPGAFMSLLGITLLNEIVNANGITTSNMILNELRKRVINCLQQHRREVTTRDGMDISICVLDKKTGKLQFAGAMNDMVRIRDGKLEIIRADYLDISISYSHLGNFRQTEIECKKGDMLYLFSDGYQDQFGGEFDKKFLRPHFYTTLVEVHKYPVLNQKEILEKKLFNWMKSRPQTDDITILGVRI